ncbi:MAG: aldehyde dehydrogenase family protein [Chthoniobacterales bacterium]
MLDSKVDEVRAAVASAQAAQPSWSARSLGERARWLGEVRAHLAENVDALARAAAAPASRSLSEKIVSEVLPLIEAARFLQKNAPRILAPRFFGRRGRPFWLPGHSFTVARKPFGVILIVGPSNYPLFLPAVQTLHALAAGNAVVIKPAEGCREPLAKFIELVIRPAGLPMNLVQLLPEKPEAARAALRHGIGKAIFTGSSENGRAFLADLAIHNTPSVMELSGADAVFIRADADLDLAAKAIAFGLRLNAGNTCMAPHAIIAYRQIVPALQAKMRALDLPTDGIFAVQDDEQALEIAGFDEHGLGASIFARDENAARAFADQLGTGFVTINDMIVPTADPRLPFGGVRASGFGSTRGAEGLLEMTYPQAIALRRSRFLPHLEPLASDDAEFFAAYIRTVHGRGWRQRLHSLGKLLRLGRERVQISRKNK